MEHHAILQLLWAQTPKRRYWHLLMQIKNTEIGKCIAHGNMSLILNKGNNMTTNYLTPVFGLIILATMMALTLTFIIGVIAIIIAFFTGASTLVIVLTASSIILLPTLILLLALLSLINLWVRAFMAFAMHVQQEWIRRTRRRVKTISGHDIKALHYVVMELKSQGWRISQGVSEEISAPYNYVLEMEL